MFDIPVIEHCEEQTLKGDGVAHEGFHASTLGLRGIPGEAESIMALRDISLAELTGGVVHIAHMSARQTLDAVRYGKARGAPCHLRGDAASFRADRRDAGGAGALRHQREDESAAARARPTATPCCKGIADGSVDVIATDHAPHHYDEKQVEFDHAPFGITGLETAVSLCFDRLVHPGVVTLPRLVELLSVNPARILRVPGGSLAEGAPADITHPGARSAR